MHKLISTLFVFALVLPGLQPAAADQGASDRVIQARGGQTALFIWDASGTVAAITAAKTDAASGLRRLEVQAMRIAMSRAAGIPHSRMIDVRVVYMRSGAVSPEYQTATFAGVERVFTLSVSRVDAMRGGTALTTALGSGRVPRNVRLTVTGRLPNVQ